jgi:hypothetical protein
MLALLFSQWCCIPRYKERVKKKSLKFVIPANCRPTMTWILFHMLPPLFWRFWGGLPLCPGVKRLSWLDLNRSYSSFAGLPHYIDTDDIYNGYLIPGGSIIIANSWSVLLYHPRMPVHELLTGAWLVMRKSTPMLDLSSLSVSSKMALLGKRLEILAISSLALADGASSSDLQYRL